MAGKKARFLAPTEIVGAFLFSQTRPWKTVRSQKSRYADANLLWSGSASPSRKEEWGRKVKSPHCLHRQSDTQRLLSKKMARMGDGAKPLASQKPAALLSECPERLSGKSTYSGGDLQNFGFVRLCKRHSAHTALKRLQFRQSANLCD